MQVIIDVMAWQPRLDLERSWYFETSYESEITYLKTLLGLLKTAINRMMDFEHSENQKVRDYLNLSFKLSDSYASVAWTDVDLEKIEKEFYRRRTV